MAVRRYCDWCDRLIDDTDPYFYVTLSPSEQSTYRGTHFAKTNNEICNSCMYAIHEFVRNIKKREKYV